MARTHRLAVTIIRCDVKVIWYSTIVGCTGYFSVACPVISLTKISNIALHSKTQEENLVYLFYPRRRDRRIRSRA